MTPTLPDTLTNAVLAAISDASFSVDIPKLSPDLWDRVCILTPENKAENERLEFLGDALMDACFGIDLYEKLPDGTPFMYTELRSALHRNLVFCHLANKMGIITSGHTKSLGDVFETLVGAYYTEKGFHALHEWAKRTYEPIIEAAVRAYYEYAAKVSALGSSAQSPGPGTSPSKGKGKRRHSAAAGPSSSSATTRHSYVSTNATIMVGSPPSAGGSTIENRTTHNAVLTTAVPQDVHSGSAGTPSSLPSYLSRNMENLDLDGPEIPTTRPIARSQYSLVLDDDPLPEFWEAVRMPDGNIFFVDHKTQTTTWDDPRSRAQRDAEAVDINSAWAARLMSPLPDTPEGFRTQFSSLPTEPLAEAYLHKDPPFPELLRDGYVFDPSFPNLPEGPLPDFWEEQRGSDGHVYYIDHAGATIIKKASLLG